MTAATPGPVNAAHFEQVGEIRGKPQQQAGFMRARVEILGGNAFIAGRLPQELGARDVQRLALHRNFLAAGNVRIG
jgi:hypothetical protein